MMASVRHDPPAPPAPSEWQRAERSSARPRARERRPLRLALAAWLRRALHEPEPAAEDARDAERRERQRHRA